RHVAQDLVQQMMLGSILFAKESQKHPAELRNMVTSPGGTSAEAIYQTEEGGLRTVLSKAVWAAYQRAEALGRKEKNQERYGMGDGEECKRGRGEYVRGLLPFPLFPYSPFSPIQDSATENLILSTQDQCDGLGVKLMLFDQDSRR